MTAPVSMSDISEALAYNSLDLGTLIKYGGINRWAFHKPVRFNDRHSPTDAQMANIHCGLVPVSVVKLLRMSIGYTGGSYSYTRAECLAQIAAWTYNRPRGKATYLEWFRMLDFVGYNGDAVSPDAGWTAKTLSASDLEKAGQIYIKVVETGDYTGTNFKVIPKNSSSDSDSSPYNGLLYTGFRMRLGPASGASIGDVTDMEIPIEYITPLTEDWRIAMAVWIPNFGTAGGWGIFAGRMTTHQGISEAGSGTQLMTVFPDFATNQFAAALMRSYAQAQGGYSFDAVPLLIKDLSWKKDTLGGVPDTFMLYATANTEAYSMPSGQLAVSVDCGGGSMTTYYQIIYTPGSGYTTGAILNTDSSQHTFDYEVYQNGVLNTSGSVTLAGGAQQTVGGAASGVNLTITVTAQDGQPV